MAKYCQADVGIEMNVWHCFLDFISRKAEDVCAVHVSLATTLYALIEYTAMQALLVIRPLAHMS